MLFWYGSGSTTLLLGDPNFNVSSRNYFSFTRVERKSFLDPNFQRLSYTFTPFFLSSWILFSVLVAANLLRLAGDRLLQGVRGQPHPQDENNLEPVDPQV